MSWIHRIDIKEEWNARKDGRITIPELVQKIVPKFRAIPPGLFTPQLKKLLIRLENLKADCDPSLDFDPVWNGIYNWADEQRVWIGTF